MWLKPLCVKRVSFESEYRLEKKESDQLVNKQKKEPTIVKLATPEDKVSKCLFKGSYIASNGYLVGKKKNKTTSQAFHVKCYCCSQRSVGDPLFRAGSAGTR